MTCCPSLWLFVVCWTNSFAVSWAFALMTSSGWDFSFYQFEYPVPSLPTTRCGSTALARPLYRQSATWTSPPVLNKWTAPQKKKKTRQSHFLLLPFCSRRRRGAKPVSLIKLGPSPDRRPIRPPQQTKRCRDNDDQTDAVGRNFNSPVHTQSPTTETCTKLRRTGRRRICRKISFPTSAAGG